MKINKQNRKKYLKLGYSEVKIGEYIDVNIKDLSKYSHQKINAICDYCGSQYSVKFSEINISRNESMVQKDSCKKCGNIKQKDSVKQKYGVENISQLKSVKIKKENISLQKYGVKHPAQNYKVKELAKQTCLKRYGTKSPMQCESVKCKSANSYFMSGKIRTSSQQLDVFNMILNLGYDAVLNYPESLLNLDIAIFIDDKKIDIEYDGWYWHQNIKKDISRNKVLVKYGWNVIRILSRTLLPTKEQLQQAINNVLSNNKQIQLIQLDDWKNNDKKEVI